MLSAGPCYTDDAHANIAATPVTIITGFLGAGKTTLLRHVLASPHGLRIAVIQNELSAVAGLEATTMVGPDGETFEEWLELANGCVCCAVRDDLVSAIERLMDMRGRFDYVLVETTGMADPGPVAESFWLDRELESPLRLDGIVAVVDAVNLTHQLGTLEACRQIGCADAIILNKMDALSSTTKHVSTPGEDIALAEGEATKAVSPMTTDADPCQAALDPPLITESHTAETNLSLEMLMSELRILNEMAPVYQATRSCGALAWLHLL